MKELIIKIYRAALISEYNIKYKLLNIFFRKALILMQRNLKAKPKDKMLLRLNAVKVE